MTRHLVTSALPYANGAIHLGHLVEYIQTDIWVRTRRAEGHDVIYLCADDTHGTPIELRARAEGITPEELVGRVHEEHSRDFAAFDVDFDLFYTTNSPENRELAEMIYRALKAGDHLERRSSMQFYSENLGRFLPDRMVRGTCPKCGATDQYGDACEVCNSTYEPTDLIDPVDAIEGGTPVLRETEQIYVRLADFVDVLRDWRERGVPQASTRNFVDAWIDGGLDAWCISREAPYFGFEIPDEPGKYFYVWLDAPIGYIAATKKWCDDRGRDWREYWGPDADATVTHVIGKDIVYFHTLFWPAMLHAAGLKTPDRVQVHGFLTVNGTKMSKSRGTFINAATFAEHLDPDYLRFYYATKLGPNVDDIDLHLEDFVAKVNSDLVNNVVNLCSRVTKFVDKRFDGALAEVDLAQVPLAQTLRDGAADIRAAYGEWNFAAGLRRVRELGDAVNLYFQDSEPWKVIATDPDEAQRICTVALHGAVVLMAALTPIVPRTAGRFAAALGLERLTWEHADGWLPEHVDAPETLIERIRPEQVEAIVEATRGESAEAADAARDDVVVVEDFADTIAFEDFAKVDLRVGVVEEAAEVEGASKLLRLVVHCGRRITVFAGVRKAYNDPAVLVGRRVIVVANLAPRKMRFGTSEGMLLAMSGPDDDGLQLALVSDDAKGGWSVR